MDTTIQKKVVDLLKLSNKTLAIAESCTGGLVSKKITDISGASAVFSCGVVAYSNEIKQRLLGVNENTLENFGAVSEQTAIEMAKGVKKLALADIGLGITGIAGPTSDNSLKPVGLIFIAISYDDKIKTLKLNNKFNDNIRDNNREHTAINSLLLLSDYLQTLI